MALEKGKLQYAQHEIDFLLFTAICLVASGNNVRFGMQISSNVSFGRMGCRNYLFIDLFYSAQFFFQLHAPILEPDLITKRDITNELHHQHRLESYQILICRSVRQRACAISMRLRRVK